MLVLLQVSRTLVFVVHEEEGVVAETEVASDVAGKEEETKFFTGSAIVAFVEEMTGSFPFFDFKLLFSFSIFTSCTSLLCIPILFLVCSPFTSLPFIESTSFTGLEGK